MFTHKLFNGKKDCIDDNLTRSSMATNTRLTYAKSWLVFVTFCQTRNLKYLPATSQTIYKFLIYLVQDKHLSKTSLFVFYSAINRYYQDYGYDALSHNPKIKNLLKNLTKSQIHIVRQVKAFSVEHLQQIIKICPANTKGLRDIAILTLGFSAALRRSEICNLQYTDLEFISGNKMLIHIRKSKTDQAGYGYKIPVLNGKNLQTIARLTQWLKLGHITEGYVFQSLIRNGRLTGRPLHHSDIARIVKYYAQAIGLDAQAYSGHSLRAGFITSAAKHHARLDKIMLISRHRHLDTVMQYIRDSRIFEDHAGQKFL